MFSEEHHALAKSTHCTSEGKPVCATEKMVQDTIDDQPFSWLELPVEFSTSSNKRFRSDEEKSMNLDDASLLTSRTTDLLTTKQKMDHETNKLSTLTTATIESAEGQDPSEAG